MEKGDFMKLYNTGIYIGKFFPLHNGHIMAINKISDLCEKVYIVFYYDEKNETQLSNLSNLYYYIDNRINDAKEIFKGTNIEVVKYEVKQTHVFPRDFIKIKKDLFDIIGVKKIDIQIFGLEEEAIYKNYIYAQSYITSDPYFIEINNKKVSLHASLMRGNIFQFKQYLPGIVFDSIQKSKRTTIVCIAGKSGSGKSTFSKILVNNLNDAIHLDIDQLAHEALKDTFTKTKILKLAGQKILNNNSEIDRKLLGQIVFNNKSLKDNVYEITWQYMNSIIQRILSEGHDIVILDWYNIINKDYWNENNIKIIIKRDFNKRKEYVIKRDNITEEYFDLREQNSVNYDNITFDFIISDNNDCDIYLQKIKNIINEKLKNILMIKYN